MKKTLAIFLTALLAVGFSASVFAQDGEPKLKISGEAKTGISWAESQDEGKEAKTNLRLGSADDANFNPANIRKGVGDEGADGRFRLNLDYENGKGLGMRVRIDWHSWRDSVPDSWAYAFGYGNFFEDQLTVSIGRLGASPWSSGGPELWKELETTRTGGMRVEYKPAFMQERGWGKVNVGFVLNWFDDPDEEGSAATIPTLGDILQESVLGVSYTHDLFMARFAYRLDNIRDHKYREKENEGGKLLYRVEEYMLRELVPGLSAWALGYYMGVGAEKDEYYEFINWQFTEYSPPELFGLATPFTAQLRLGYEYITNRSVFHVRPSFYWNFFDKLLSVGTSFSFAQDFGHKIYDGSPFLYIGFEPKIQINFSSSYIAFVYNWQRMYISGDYPERRGADPINQTQFINLRFCVYY